MAEQGKPKKVSYATSLLRGAYDGDIFQHYLKGAIIEMEPFDTFKANFPGQTDEWYGTNYGAAQFNLENRFKKRNFDPHKVSGRYSNSFRKDPNFDAPDVWSPIPSDEFIKTGSASAYIIPGADKGADIVERQHTQKIADQNKIYRDDEGVLKPLEFHTDQDNFLYQGWDDETMSNIWHELKPGEIGDPNEMRAHRLLGTSASLESSSLGSILRGGWSGAGSKSIKAAAGLLIHLATQKHLMRRMLKVHSMTSHVI